MINFSKANRITNTKSAFTIVELLVVIVVIGILATITIVSYSGVQNKAIIASLQSDLSNAATQFRIFNVDNGYYPVSISTDCVTTPTSTTNICLKASPGNSYTTIAYANPTPQSFALTAINGNRVYHIVENSAVITGPPNLAITDPANWILVGTQVWARYNLNVGAQIAGATDQTNNAGSNVVEKYCYDNIASNCTTNNNGGLYQWNEAMRYTPSPTHPAVVQGICPTGSHIPSDNEWKTLELSLGMEAGSGAGQVDASGVRGTDQGAKLRSGGSSGINIPLVGYRFTDTGFYNSLAYAAFWSSTESGGIIWSRYLYSSQTYIYRFLQSKDVGYSVRCIGN